MPTKPEDKEIMRVVLDTLGTNAHALAKKIGVSGATVHQVTSGRNKLSAELILSICEHHPEINLTYLRTGQGRVTVNQNNARASLSSMAEELAEIRKLLEKHLSKDSL